MVSSHRTGTVTWETAVEVVKLVESIAVAIGRWPEEVGQLGNSHRSVVDTGIHNSAEDNVAARVTVASRVH